MAKKKKNKNGVIYQLVGQDKGRVSAFIASKLVADQVYRKELLRIAQREGVPMDENVIFRPELMAFIRKPVLPPQS